MYIYVSSVYTHTLPYTSIVHRDVNIQHTFPRICKTKTRSDQSREIRIAIGSVKSVRMQTYMPKSLKMERQTTVAFPRYVFV